jgi:hypothetical protein
MRRSLKREIGWDVKREELLTIRGEQSKRYALSRTDNGDILSVCSSMYKPFYNADLIQLVERIESLSHFRCVGFEQFQKGKRILAFLKDNRPVSLLNDSAEHYLIIGNSHDQSSKIFMGLSNYMFRCENQFSRELYTLRVKHTHRLEMSDDDIKKLLTKYERGKMEQIFLSTELSKLHVGGDEVHKFLEFLFPEPIAAEQMTGHAMETLRRSSRQRHEMLESIQLEMKDLGKNAWGMFNGVTFFTSNRMRGNPGFGNTNGTAHRLNARAWQYCVKLLESYNEPQFV